MSDQTRRMRLKCLAIGPAQNIRIVQELPQDILKKPSHEIMVLSVLRKLILQTRMLSHPVMRDVWCLVGPFVYYHTSCVRTAKALARLRDCAGSPEPSPVAYVISTIIAWAGSNDNIWHSTTCPGYLHACFIKIPDPIITKQLRTRSRASNSEVNCPVWWKFELTLCLSYLPARLRKIRSKTPDFLYYMCPGKVFVADGRVNPF